MTIDQWLKSNQTKLTAAGIETARLDCLVLLEDVLHKDRALLLAHPEIIVDQKTINVLRQQIERRQKSEPLAYIRKKSEFYGRNFIVSKSVLVPRPESESMIDALLEVVASKAYKAQKRLPAAAARLAHSTQTKLLDISSDSSGLRLADVGCGSGALGITAKLELPNSQIELIDVDPQALETAHSNVVMHTIDAKTVQSDLLSSTTSKFDILLANLPYVPDSMEINMAASFEPSIALFGGQDGLNLYRRLFQNIRLDQRFLLYIIIECFPEQQKKMQRIAKDNGFFLLRTENFNQTYGTALLD